MATRQAIKRFGILNTTVAESDRLYGYPFPGTFLLNRDGIVTSRFFERTYQERNTVASILVHLGKNVDVPATRVSSPQIDITSFATDATAAAGTHFSLVLDIRPAPKVHVYAPGVTGYRPITLSIEAQPGLVMRNVTYPEPEDYYFKPLNEHVPVFQHPFRIVQDMTIDPTPQGQAALKEVSTLTIKGTLSYQACDDRVCFSPRSIPLSWDITVKPLDRERAKR